ncbi:Dihydrodipicolinate synthase [Thecaphora frezii]
MSVEWERRTRVAKSDGWNSSLASRSVEAKGWYAPNRTSTRPSCHRPHRGAAIATATSLAVAVQPTLPLPTTSILGLPQHPPPPLQPPNRSSAPPALAALLLRYKSNPSPTSSPPSSTLLSLFPMSDLIGGASSLDVVIQTLQTTFSNPLNLLLFALFLYILAPLLLPTDARSSKHTPTLHEARSHATAPSDRYTFLASHHPDTVEWRRYTPRTLALYDGTNPSPSPSAPARILLAINRKVFDVTSGRNFYGPGGPYGNFAGRDASRGMAKQSFDLDIITPLDKPIDLLDDLTQSEIKNMNEWEAMFTGKYGIVGELVNEDELDATA